MYADSLVFAICYGMQAVDCFAAGIVQSRDRQHSKVRPEGSECRCNKAEREEAVSKAFRTPGPDPGSTCCGNGQEWRDCVDDETPFLVWLEAIKEDIEEVGEKDIARWLAERTDKDGDGDAEVVS